MCEDVVLKYPRQISQHYLFYLVITGYLQYKVCHILSIDSSIMHNKWLLISTAKRGR